MISPVFFPEMIWIDDSPEELSERFVQSFKKHCIDAGNFSSILKYLPPLEIRRGKIEVPFPKLKVSDFPSDFSRSFDFFHAKLPFENYWGSIPILGIEACGESPEDLEKKLSENVRLEFSRKKRFATVRSMIESMWFRGVEKSERTIFLDLPTLQELDAVSGKKAAKVLAEVAEPIKVSEGNAFGLEREFQKLSKIFPEDFQRSLLVVGPSSTGKSALIREFFGRKSKQKPALSFWETSASRLLQKLTVPGGWREKLNQLCRELREPGKILFIPNLFEVFQVGQYEGNDLSIADGMAEFLKTNEIVLFTECTPEEYGFIEKIKPTFFAAFEVVRLCEPPDAFEIVRKAVTKISRSQGVDIEKDAIEEIFRLQKRFSPYAGFPGKSIKFFENAFFHRGINSKTMKKSDIIDLFHEDTGLPKFLVDPDIPLIPDATEDFFQKNVLGQPESVRIVCDVIFSLKTFLSRPGKPLASLLFIDPTGVGKTEMAKVLAEFMFGSREKIIRFDMSEFSDPVSVLRLTGDSLFSEGLLSSKVRQNPFSVILFDEIEKAHHSFFDVLLQIMGEGRLTDAKGKTANFQGTILIMTSNIGSESFQKGISGFSGGAETRKKAADHFQKEVMEHFRPEFFNRIDQIVPFSFLDRETLKLVVRREIEKIGGRNGIRLREFHFRVSEEILDFLAASGYDSKYGARQLQRVIRKVLLVPIAMEMNGSSLQKTMPALDLREGVPETLAAGSRRGGALRVSAKKTAETGVSALNPREELGKRVSEFRRISLKLREAGFLLQLQSELHIMEQRKQKEKQSFWENREQGIRYSNALDLSERFTRFFAGIESLETDVGVSILGKTGVPRDFEEIFSGLSTDLERNKIDLYKFFFPSSDICTIGLYGPSEALLAASEIYFTLGKEKGFEIASKAVFLKENRIQRDDLKKTLSGKEKIGTILGVHHQFTGNCAFLFFHQEDGIHCWERKKSVGKSIAMREELSFSVVVRNVLEINHELPENIERKPVFEQSPRRFYKENWFKDLQYKFDEPTDRFEAVLLKALNKNFTENLDNGLFGIKSFAGNKAP